MDQNLSAVLSSDLLETYFHTTDTQLRNAVEDELAIRKRAADQRAYDSEWVE